METGPPHDLEHHSILYKFDYFFKYFSYLDRCISTNCGHKKTKNELKNVLFILFLLVFINLSEGFLKFRRKQLE